MSDYKPITINIRRWWGLCVSDKMDTHLRKGFDNLCDAIDAIHAQLEDENERLKAERDAAYNKGYDEGFASADDWLAQHEDAMAERGWVRLPKDADGEYIHVGDMLAGEKAGGFGLCEPFEVGCILFGNGIIQVNDVHGLTRCAEFAHHYQPDTWERIIEDARTCTGSVGNYTSVPSMRWTNEVDALVARCRALCERTNGGGA